MENAPFTCHSKAGLASESCMNGCVKKAARREARPPGYVQNGREKLLLSRDVALEPFVCTALILHAGVLGGNDHFHAKLKELNSGRNRVLCYTCKTYELFN